MSDIWFQIPIYFGIYCLGWFPIRKILHWMFSPSQKVESDNVDQLTTPIMQYVSILNVALNACRGYLLVLIAHDVLVLDSDLVIATVLFLAGLFWPIGYRQKQQVYWPVFLGVFIYLLPSYGWFFPVILFMAFIVFNSILYAYLITFTLYFILFSLDTFNSLYFIFYGIIVGMSLIYYIPKRTYKFSSWLADIKSNI